LDVARLARHKARSGSVAGFGGSEPISDCDLLGLECEVLVAAALDNAIHCRNAPVIRARMVAEAAQTPLTPGADRVLESKGVLLLPDLLCNAGAPLEWWVAQRPEQGDVAGVVGRCFESLSAAAREWGTGMRQAAYRLAVGRVAAGQA
jgi:glutamate dehydrogenase/leucine dehydrogenase